jgi:CBS domain-containing protein
MDTRVYSILKHKGDNVITAVPDQSVASFAALLYAYHIGATPVVDEENHPIGMMSERDIIHGIIERGTGALKLPVSALMTPLIATCKRDDKIGDVLEKISMHRTRHIPVVGEEGKLEGIISIGDVVQQLLDEAQFEVSSLRTYITSP